MTNYRKLWEAHYGPIPKDDKGRSYHIHHIDGDRLNNDITNLKMVTIKEHYDIHYANEDWRSCVLLGLKMRVDPSEISRLNKLAANKRISEGTHHFIGSSNPSTTRLKEGTHHFIGASNPTVRRISEGTHHFQSSEYQKTLQENRIKSNTHNFLGDSNPGKREWTCSVCGLTGTGLANAKRWHFDNCRKTPNVH